MMEERHVIGGMKTLQPECLKTKTQVKFCVCFMCLHPIFIPFLSLCLTSNGLFFKLQQGISSLNVLTIL